MLTLVRATLVLAILVFGPGLFEQFESPKAAVVRVAGLGLLAAGVVPVRPLRRRVLQPLDLAVLAWLAVEVLATIFSQAPLLSLLGEPEQRDGLLTSLALAGLYLGARLGTRDRARALGTLDALLAAVALSCAYALLQAVGLDPLAWTRVATYGPGGEMVRPFGTLGHPNLLGLAGAAAAVAGLAVAATQTRRRRAYWLAALVLAVATLLTFSRAAWLGLVAGALVAGALVLRAAPRNRLSRRTALVAAGALVVGVGAVVLSGLGGLVALRLAELVSPTSGSGRSRLEIWRAAAAAWQARPVLGQGPDVFGLVYPRYQTPAYWLYEWSGHPAHAHSIYLHVLATRGALGLLVGVGWGAGLLLAARRAWRAGGERRPLVAAWLGALVAVGVAGVFGALGMAGAVLVIVASGTLVALADGGVGHAATGGAPVKSSRRRAARAKAQQRGGPVAARARLDRAALVAGAVVGAVALVLSGLDLAASRACAEARGLLEESRALGGTVRQGALGAAGQAALRASALMPTHDMPFRLRGEALMALAAGSRDAPALLDQAESALRRAVALLPLRALNHERLASLLAARAVSGDRAAIPRAEAAFARAVELAPVDVFPLVDWARAELALSRPQAAIEPARRAVALYPDEALARSMLAAAQLSLGQREAARATLERAMAGEWHGNLREREMTQRLLESLR